MFKVLETVQAFIQGTDLLLPQTPLGSKFHFQGIWTLRWRWWRHSLYFGVHPPSDASRCWSAPSAGKAQEKGVANGSNISISPGKPSHDQIQKGILPSRTVNMPVQPPVSRKFSLSEPNGGSIAKRLKQLKSEIQDLVCKTLQKFQTQGWESSESPADGSMITTHNTSPHLYKIKKHKDQKDL